MASISTSSRDQLQLATENIRDVLNSLDKRDEDATGCISCGGVYGSVSIGETHTGASTMINALIGDEILPIGNESDTNVVTAVMGSSYGNDSKFAYVYTIRPLCDGTASSAKTIIRLATIADKFDNANPSESFYEQYDNQGVTIIDVGEEPINEGIPVTVIRIPCDGDEWKEMVHGSIANSIASMTNYMGGYSHHQLGLVLAVFPSQFLLPNLAHVIVPSLSVNNSEMVILFLVQFFNLVSVIGLYIFNTKLHPPPITKILPVLRHSLFMKQVTIVNTSTEGKVYAGGSLITTTNNYYYLKVEEKIGYAIDPTTERRARISYLEFNPNDIMNQVINGDETTDTVDFSIYKILSNVKDIYKVFINDETTVRMLRMLGNDHSNTSDDDHSNTLSDIGVNLLTDPSLALSIAYPSFDKSYIDVILNVANIFLSNLYIISDANRYVFQPGNVMRNTQKSLGILSSLLLAGEGVEGGTVMQQFARSVTYGDYVSIVAFDQTVKISLHPPAVCRAIDGVIAVIPLIINIPTADPFILAAAHYSDSGENTVTFFSLITDICS